MYEQTLPACEQEPVFNERLLTSDLGENEARGGSSNEVHCAACVASSMGIHAPLAGGVWNPRTWDSTALQAHTFVCATPPPKPP